MKHAFTKTIVVALGGSIVHPEEIDTKFLKDFKKFLAPFLRRGVKFVFVIGGGSLARRFQVAAHKVSKLTNDDKDWIGIHATRLNAHLLRTIFRVIADPVIIDARGKVSKLKYPVTIAAGWRPGWSTDYVAMRLAADFGVPEVIIAGKPPHVYEKDPAKYPRAKKFDEISWKAYRKLVPTKWNPGLHAPVDPIAAALGDKEDVQAIIINGRDMKNFRALLNGSEFTGTIIG